MPYTAHCETARSLLIKTFAEKQMKHQVRSMDPTYTTAVSLSALLHMSFRKSHNQMPISSDTVTLSYDK